MKTLLTLSAVIFLAFSGTAQTDILDARTNFSDDDEVTVTGIVTNGAEFGSVRYIQDETAGIAIYPGTDWGSFDEPALGDEITVTGILSTFSGLLEVGPDLSAVTINSSDNPSPEPQLLTPVQMDEDDEGELVYFEGCLMDAAGNSFAGNTTYTFQSNGEQGVLYVRTGNPLVGTAIPWGELTITGIASQFSFDGFGGYQLLPRTSDDMLNSSSINIASEITITNITTESFELDWLTDVEGDTKVEFGLTSALGSEQATVESTTEHTMVLSGLDLATVYFVRVSSTNGVDTAYSTIRPYVTRSNSSGEIKVYFTGNVETSVATIEEAVGLGTATNDTIAAYITNAQSTLDIAMYNINDQTITAAINQAYDNGVVIRYIAQGTNANVGIDSFNDGIQVLEREDDNGSGMHNKFVIIDADDEDNCQLITGSTNFTTGGLVSDFNNVIVFQEQSLCRGFELEFEEMWGSNGDMPDSGNAKFGSEKSFNTPTLYYAGDVLVEAYFSPSDFVNQEILNTLAETDAELDLALLVFTQNDLGDGVLEVNDSFFSFARGMVEDSGVDGSEFDFLLGNGVELYSHQGIDGQLHHKYCIVDPNDVDDDPTVLTGSHNWSNSANNVNDENTVIVHDARVANLYYQEFISLWMTFVGIDEIPAASISIYPNPTTDYITISWDGLIDEVPYRIVDLQGKNVDMGWISGQGITTTIPVNQLQAGTYLFQVVDGKSGATQFVIK